MDQDLEYRIRQRAYELWEHDGKPAGQHLTYWLAAEREYREKISNADLDEELEETFPASDPPSSTLRTGKDAA